MLLRPPPFAQNVWRTTGPVGRPAFASSGSVNDTYASDEPWNPTRPASSVDADRSNPAPAVSRCSDVASTRPVPEDTPSRHKLTLSPLPAEKITPEAVQTAGVASRRATTRSPSL